MSYLASGNVAQIQASANTPANTTGLTSPLVIDANGSLKINISSGGALSGAVASPSPDVITVQGNTSMIAILTRSAYGANTVTYVPPSGGLVTTGVVNAISAAGASLRNYIRSAQIINSNTTVSTEVLISDGSGGTVLWRGFAAYDGGGGSFTFDPPLRGSLNTNVAISEITATGTGNSGGVLVNLQGFKDA